MPVPVPVPAVAPLAVAPPVVPLPVAVWVLALPVDDAPVVAGAVAAVEGVAGVGAWVWAGGGDAGRTLGTLSTALGTWRVTGVVVDVEVAGAVAVELTAAASSFGPGATTSGRRSAGSTTVALSPR